MPLRSPHGKAAGRASSFTALGDALLAVIARLAVRAIDYHRRRAADARLSTAQRNQHLAEIAAIRQVLSLDGEGSAPNA